MLPEKYRLWIETFCIILFMFLFCILLFYYKGIWPFGNETIIWADMTHSSPLFYYLYDVLSGEDSFFFTWRYGTGIDMLGIVSQQGMLSPINIILLLFKRKYTYGSVGILLAVKMAFMSGSMYFYLSKYKVGIIFKSAGAFAYAMGMSVLLQNPILMTLDIGILFPLLVWAYEEGINNRKKYWYPVLLGVSMALNLYMSVMVIFYIIISTGVEVLLAFKKQKILYKLYYVVVASLEGMALSAIVWFPVLLNYVNSSRLNVSYFKMYVSAVQTYNYPNQIWLVLLNLSMFIALTIVGLKKCCSYNKDIIYSGGKWLMIFLSVFIPPIELLWHMGSHAGWAWRFCFIFQFVMIDFAISLQSVDHEKAHVIYSLKYKYLVRITDCWIVITGMLMLHIVYQKYSEFSVADMGVLYGSCILVILYIIIMQVSRKEPSVGCVCIAALFLVEITVNGVIWLSPSWKDRQDRKDMAYLFEAAAVAEEVENIENKWDRTKDYQGRFGSNYAAVMKVNSVANWIHLIKREQQEVLERFGYALTYTRFLDNGGTVFSDIIFGYRNTFSKSPIVSKAWKQNENIHSINWYTMNYNVPFIIALHSNNLLGETEEAANVFQYQNAFFYNLTGINELLFTELDLNQSFFESGEDVFFEQDKELYMWTDGTRPFSIKIDDEYVRIQDLADADNIVYPVPFNNGIISLGFYKSGENCHIKLETDLDNVNSSSIHIAEMDYEVLERGIETIKFNTPGYRLDFENTGVNIKVHNTESPVVGFLLPVLYNKGWNCTINGARTEIMNADGFLCIPAVSQDMDIKLRYYPEGIKEGGMLFLVLQLVVGLILLCHKKWEAIIERITGYLAVSGIIVFIFAVYVIPIICMGSHILMKLILIMKNNVVVF